VVEDEDAVRQSEVEFLSAVGYTVLSAANGKEALDQVRARAKMIDLVITDVVMPKMSGPVLVANLTSLRPDIKVLFVSGYSNETVHSDRVFQTSLATFCRSLSFCDRWPERSAKSSTELPWRTPPVQRDLDSPLALV
jgi:CheY-like chemotaxis protein